MRASVAQGLAYPLPALQVDRAPSVCTTRSLERSAARDSLSTRDTLKRNRMDETSAYRIPGFDKACRHRYRNSL